MKQWPLWGKLIVACLMCLSAVFIIVFIIQKL
jgi:hypothetical protein